MRCDDLEMTLGEMMGCVGGVSVFTPRFLPLAGLHYRNEIIFVMIARSAAKDFIL